MTPIHPHMSALCWSFLLYVCAGAFPLEAAESRKIGEKLSNHRHRDTCFIPSAPNLFAARQPDGAQVFLRRRGDEYHSWHEDNDGFVVRKNSAGFWNYTHAESGRSSLTDVPHAIVGRVDPGHLALTRRQLGTVPPPVHMDDIHVPAGDPQASGFALAEALGAPPTTTEDGQPNPPPVSGQVTVRNLVILAAFADHWNDSTGTVLSTYGRPASEYDPLFNEIGYSSNGAEGSVKDYYNEVSYNKLIIESSISPWVPLPENEAFYGAPSGSKRDSNTKAMAADAIAALEATGFDFSAYDGNGDGWVDCLTIIHSGVGEEWGGNSSNAIWSHQSRLSDVTTLDGVRLSAYHTAPAMRKAGEGIARIGIICHEMGHIFGLPDLYDYSNSTQGLGDWCLMAGGAWGGDAGSRPTHFCAWSKVALGFVEPKVISSGDDIPLARSADSPTVHMVFHGSDDSEHFLLENRGSFGFDAGTPQGILIYHIYNKSRNNALGVDYNPHPLVYLEEADGNHGLKYNDARQFSDVWTASNGLSGGFDDSTGSANTNAMRYQSGSHTQRTNSPSSYTGIAISDFSAPGQTMTYDLRTVVPALEEGDPSRQTPFTLSWRDASGATSYELQYGTPTTITSYQIGFENADDLLREWVLAGCRRVSTTEAIGAAQSGAYSLLLTENDQLFGPSTYWRHRNGLQSATLRSAFTLTTQTQLAYAYKSKSVKGNNPLRVEATNNNGQTWVTLASHGGNVNSWTPSSLSYYSFSSAGFSAGDTIRIRFLSFANSVFGWNTFPSYGFAVDSVTLSGIEMPGFSSWTTYSEDIFDTSVSIDGIPSGPTAFRTRARVDGEWQPWSAPISLSVLSLVKDRIIAMDLITGWSWTMSPGPTDPVPTINNGQEVFDSVLSREDQTLSVTPSGSN